MSCAKENSNLFASDPASSDKFVSVSSGGGSGDSNNSTLVLIALVTLILSFITALRKN